MSVVVHKMVLVFQKEQRGESHAVLLCNFILDDSRSYVCLQKVLEKFTRYILITEKCRIRRG